MLQAKSSEEFSSPKIAGEPSRIMTGRHWPGRNVFSHSCYIHAVAVINKDKATGSPMAYLFPMIDHILTN